MFALRTRTHRLLPNQADGARPLSTCRRPPGIDHAWLARLLLDDTTIPPY
jgi:hypothetical protein